MKRLKQNLHGLSIGDTVDTDYMLGKVKILAFGKIKDNFITQIIYNCKRGLEIGDEVAVLRWNVKGTLIDCSDSVLNDFYTYQRDMVVFKIDPDHEYEEGELVDVHFINESCTHGIINGYTEVEIYQNSIIDDYRLKGGRI